MKAFLLITCMMLITHFILGQCVCNNDLVFEAARVYRSDFAPQKAVTLYKQAFEKKLTDGSKYLEAIECAAMIGDTNSAIIFLEKGLAIGLTSATYSKLWTGLGKGISYTYVIGRMDTSAVNQYESALDHTIIRELTEMAKDDQLYRNDDGNETKQRKLDSLNWQKLRKLVTRLDRLPTYSETGFEGAENLEILFYHMDKSELAWFMPYVLAAIRCGESNLGEIILYQLDRIGMDAGVIYTVIEDGTLKEFSSRTRMRNGFWCQSYGQWFDEQNLIDRKVYETPLDPSLSMEEINRVRKLFCLDSIESKRQRRPWAAVVDMKTFEEKIKE